MLIASAHIFSEVSYSSSIFLAKVINVRFFHSTTPFCCGVYVEENSCLIPTSSQYSSMLVLSNSLPLSLLIFLILTSNCAGVFPRGVTPTSKFVCVLSFPDGDARRHRDLSWFGQEKALRPAVGESLYYLAPKCLYRGEYKRGMKCEALLRMSGDLCSCRFYS